MKLTEFQKVVNIEVMNAKVEQAKEGNTMPSLFSFKELSDKRTRVVETPRDRSIAYLSSQGLRTGEIARKLGCSAETVSLAKAQPAFKASVAALLHSAGKEDVEELLQKRSAEALEVATDMMRNAKKEELRAKSAFEILKLAIGTKVTMQTKDIPVSQIDEEIRRKSELIQSLERPATATVTASKS